jgi:hypothetical protein
MSDPLPALIYDVQPYMNRSLDNLMNELASHYFESVGGYAKGAPEDIWRRYVPRLRQRICQEWNWCERRQDARFDEPMTLAALVAEVILPDAVGWSIPAALVAVILVKQGLDALCECPPLGSPGE